MRTRSSRVGYGVSLLLIAATGACSSEPGTGPDDPVETPDASTQATPTPGCGRLTTPCEPGGACEGAADCASGACTDGKCVDVAPPDNQKNNDETDVDCGGTKAPACDDGKKCALPRDCKSGVCTGGVCQAPSPTDKVKNGDETDVDCGGAKAPKCKEGKGCAGDADCDALRCDPTTKKCNPPSHTDGLKNGDETGVDCGGPTAPNKCPTGEGCVGNGDCDNVLCNTTTKKCDPPKNDDGLKNGNESDVDCGSSGVGTDTAAPACDAGKACDVGADCKSAGCNHKKVCAWARSCTMDNGGTTCGTGDATAAGNQNEDCCASEIVPTYNLDGYNNTLADFRLDKYQVTAGRIRRFLTAVNGNVQGWVQANRANIFDPAQLPPALDAYLPTGWTQANSDDDCDPEGAPVGNEIKCNYGALNQISGYRYTNQPGGDNGYACYVSAGGYATRTYRTTAAENAMVGVGEAMTLVSQARADQKAMTCGTYYIYAAFCAWDGGRLETWDEYNAAYGGGPGTGRTYPWGSDVPSRAIGFGDLFSDIVAPTTNYGYTPPGNDYSVFNAALSAQEKTDLLLRIDRANLRWNYFNRIILDYRAPLENRATAPITAENTINVANDASVAVAPPGRYPEGAGRYGHRDLLGNVLELTASASGAVPQNRRWARNGSFETAHFNATTMTGHNYGYFHHLTKYGRTGARCARPLTGYLPAPLP